MTSTELAPIVVRAAPPNVLPNLDGVGGLSWRPLTRSDVPELARLILAIEEAERRPYRTSEEEVDELFDGDWKSHDLDTQAGVDDEGRIRAYAQVGQPPGDTRVVRAFLDGGVDPSWRGRGIGRALLEWSQGRGRQKLAESGKELPARVASFVDDGSDQTIRLMRASGFEPVRYYAEMRRPLDAAGPDIDASDGITIVPWSVELDEQIRLAHNEAFADHWGSEPRTPQEWTQGRSMFAPAWSLAAIDDATGEVAGYLMSDKYEQDWELNGYSAGYTDLLGVRRAWRGRRLAGALLSAAMTAYRADRIDYAEIAVDTANPSGAHRLYADLGYVVYHSSTLYSIEL